MEKQKVNLNKLNFKKESLILEKDKKIIKEPPKKSFIKKLFLIDTVSAKEKTALIENFYTMLSANVDILVILDSLSSETRSKAVKKLIEDLKKDFGDGLSLWKAFQNAELLPQKLISILKIGEQSGQLEDSLKIVIENKQKEQDFKGKLKSAMIYPCIVFFPHDNYW